MSPPSYDGPSKHELIALVTRYNDYNRGDQFTLANVSNSDYQLADQIRCNQRRARANYSPIQVLAKELVDKIEHIFRLNDYSVKGPDQGAFQGKLADLKKLMKDFGEVNEQARRENGDNEGPRKNPRSDGHRTPQHTPPRVTKAAHTGTNKHKTEGKQESGLFKKGKAVAKDWGFDVSRKLRNEKDQKEDEDRRRRDNEYLRALEADQKKRQAKQNQLIKQAKAQAGAKPGADPLSKENIMKLENAQAGIAQHKKVPGNTMKPPIKDQEVQATTGPKDPAQFQTMPQMPQIPQIPQITQIPRAKAEDSIPKPKVEPQSFRPERAPPDDQPAANLPRNSGYHSLAELKELQRARRSPAPRGNEDTTEEGQARQVKYIAQALKEAEKAKADQIKSGEKRDEVYETKLINARAKGLALASEVRKLDAEGPSAGP